jgi:predicted PurR-regulated permease PerM
MVAFPPDAPSTGSLSGPPLPPLLQYVLVLLAVIGTVTVLSLAKSLLILLFVAGIFSFLLLPFCRRLEHWKWPTWAAAALSCFGLLIVFFGVLTFLGWQYSGFGKGLPALEQALLVQIAKGQTYLESHFHVTQGEQSAWLKKELTTLAESGGAMAMSLFATTGAVLATAVVIPIITFFLLLMKSRFRQFFVQLDAGGEGQLLRIVENISILSRRWLKGVLTVMVFLAILDSVGFLILGLKYAVLLGVTAAILNVLPYVGPWLGAVMPALIALLTKDSLMAVLGVFAVIAITQFLDNNFITPKVVGSSVQLNPLASLVALIAWGSLWGLMGLILAIPITGMMKLVFDEIPSLKSWGFLLGEDKHWPTEKRLVLRLRRRKSTARTS